MSDRNPLSRISTYVSGLIGSLLTGGAIIGAPHIPIPEHDHPEIAVYEPVVIQKYVDQVISHIDDQLIIPCR